MNMYPRCPSPGITDTSRQAAEAILPRVQTLREKALTVIRERPSSADEVSESLNESVLSMRPRVTELFKLGLIYDSGQRKKNQYGRNCIVWAAVPEQTKLF